MEIPNIEKQPMSDEGGDNQKFDAHGNPRSLTTLDDGSVVNMSKEEYEEEMASRNNK